MDRSLEATDSSRGMEGVQSATKKKKKVCLRFSAGYNGKKQRAIALSTEDNLLDAAGTSAWLSTTTLPLATLCWLTHEASERGHEHQAGYKTNYV